MSSAVDKEAVLCHINLFEGMSAESRTSLADICLPKNLARKESLFVEGTRGLAVYILVTGAVQLYKTGPESRPVVIKVVKPGEMFAEAILFEKDTYPVSAVGLKDSTLYLVPRHQFLCLLQDPLFREDFLGNLMGKVRYLTDQIKQLTSHDVEDRLLMFLGEQYGARENLTVPLSKRQVAEAIGTTPETLSRLLVRLRKGGRMTWEGKQVAVSGDLWEQVGL